MNTFKEDLIRLEKLIEGMDIPKQRKDLNNEENLFWLVRNLPINNSNSPNLKESLFILKKLVLPIVMRRFD